MPIDRAISETTQSSPVRPLAGATPRLWALVLAGPALTATGGLMTLIVWRGGWSANLQAQQLALLGWGMLANWLLLGIVVVALASVRLKGQVPGGVEFEIDSDDAGSTVSAKTT